MILDKTESTLYSLYSIQDKTCSLLVSTREEAEILRQDLYEDQKDFCKIVKIITTRVVLDDNDFTREHRDEAWYQNDELHRLDGPAIEWSDGYKSWYYKGKWYGSSNDGYTQEQFIKDFKILHSNSLIKDYQKFFAELYQYCGSLDNIDTKILDNLSAGSRGIPLPHKSIFSKGKGKK